MTGDPHSTIRALDLDDLDHVVGGAGIAAQTKEHAKEDHDSSFLSSLVHTTAAAIASGHETAKAGIAEVEAAAQKAHLSTDAALVSLLGETHSNKDVAGELTSRLTSGAAAHELADLLKGGHLKPDDAGAILASAADAVAGKMHDMDTKKDPHAHDSSDPSGGLASILAKLEASAKGSHDGKGSPSDALASEVAAIEAAAKGLAHDSKGSPSDALASQIAAIEAAAKAAAHDGKGSPSDALASEVAAIEAATKAAQDGKGLQSDALAEMAAKLSQKGAP